MTRLEWDTLPRRYETGVDRGVLYLPNGIGVPWNGLVTVEESHTGGDVSSYYFDGIKYLEQQNPKNFQATITAFTHPSEFSELMGELPVIPGFILTRQPRKRFGFSYRTLIGDGDDYKIHVVYNAMATPESRSYSTIDGSAFATSFSWKIDAVPPKSKTFRPSAHFVLDSTKTDLFTLRAIEDILYGTETRGARLPTSDELVDRVGFWSPVLISPDYVSGLSELAPGLGDLTKTKTPGLYRDLPTTRLAKTAVGGLYRLE